MAKLKTITYRLIDYSQGPFRYGIQIKKWWGWSIIKSTTDKFSLDCENEADYWMKRNYPTAHLLKKNTKKY